MRLYFKSNTRATRPLWLLEELGERGAPIAYELVPVTRELLESDAYRRIHPHGLVPALVDEDVVVFETAAICLHLADRFLERQLAPAFGTAARARYYQWVAYCPATLQPAIGQVARHTLLLPEAERVARLADDGRARFAACARVLEAALDGRRFLVEDRLSVADLLVAGDLLWAGRVGLLGDWPRLGRYCDELAARPAARRALLR